MNVYEEKRMAMEARLHTILRTINERSIQKFGIDLNTKSRKGAVARLKMAVCIYLHDLDLGTGWQTALGFAWDTGHSNVSIKTRTGLANRQGYKAELEFIESCFQTKTPQAVMAKLVTAIHTIGNELHQVVSESNRFDDCLKMMAERCPVGKEDVLLAHLNQLFNSDKI